MGASGTSRLPTNSTIVLQLCRDLHIQVRKHLVRQEQKKGSANTREIQSQGLPAVSSVQYADKTLLIPAAMALQSSGAHH